MNYMKLNEYSLPIIVYSFKTDSILFVNNIGCDLLQVSEVIKNKIEQEEIKLSYILSNNTIIERIKEKRNILLTDINIITFEKNELVCNISCNNYENDKDIVHIIIDDYKKNDKVNIILEENECLLRGLNIYTNDTYFYINLSKSQIVYTGNIENKIIENKNLSTFPEFMLREDIICREDITKYMKMYENMKNGVEENITLRLRDKKNNYNWYLVEYKILEPQKKIIGRMTNIQKQKELEKLVKEDPLTNLLNKKAFEEIVTDIVEHKKENIHYDLMLVDIDNFKAINEYLGHNFGDEILKELANKLNQTFSEADYIGRIGSNEFAIFIKYIGGEQELIKKAQHIINLFNNTYEIGSKVLHTTCSIGISSYNRNSTKSYKEVYENATLSLYHAKRNGKNNYVIYNEKIVKSNWSEIEPMEINSKYLWRNLDTKIITEVRKILFRDKNYGMCIDDVIEYITRSFELEECYVAETIDRGKTLNGIQQFNNGIRNLEDEAEKYLQGDLWEQFFEYQAKESVIYTEDVEVAKNNPIYSVLKENNVKSFLYAYNKIDDEIGYIIGFNFYKNKKHWKPVEISTIVYISKLISELLNYVKRVKTFK